MTTRPPASTALNAARRAEELDQLSEVDVLVVGLGATGAGAALDAASRGLTVAAIDAHDLAFGTSRWSSKMIHGGLRYLASGQVGVAYESAVERGILLTRTAPHLVAARQFLLPLTPAVSRGTALLTCTGLGLGDTLRAMARTPRSALPKPRRISAVEALRLAPALDPAGLRGALAHWDAQLTDDARLVVALARTAAGHGARILTRCRALRLGRVSVLRDELTGREFEVRAKVVVNAAGVWAGQLDQSIRLRPSRGTHLVLPSALFGDPVAALNIPVPGERSRFVLVLPQPDGRTYVGLTDEPVDGPIPDVPEPSQSEVDFLLSAASSALRTPIRPADVLGTFAGLRPLLAAEGKTADLSRRHAVLASEQGVVTIVGGKLTTYRRMAQDAIDRAVTLGGLTAAPCRTRDLPLVGAAPRAELGAVAAPARLVALYGTEAPLVAAGDQAPAAPGLPVTRAELDWAVTREGALDAGDLLDRRIRLGLVPEHRSAALAAAEEALRS
ncbi:glycerol-3-phosphate dehydrogenase/oxidase [Longispora albida]|uniref:glycerol-3-phosphate dehydrogenase/oxidase n=1 Tax=Longispora albida TaxID=203523 RepID=UPI000381148B|nr:glycerol-3-phosphate dehydrogenase/oxidase [Longispora albida]